MATPAPAATTASAPAVADPTPATAAGPVTTTQISSGTATAVAGVGIVSWVLGGIFLLLFHLGAAKLSYDVHQSALWGFVSFLFASIYYPYYAFTDSTRRETSSFFGGRKSRK